MDLFGGAKKTTKTTKSKKTKNTSDTKKTTKSAKTSDAKKTKKSSTTTRSKSKTKGGNFLGAIGDLVAPTGWGPFATAAGLLALDRADAALRRGTKEKKEKMKGGKKMKGGLCDSEPGQIQQVTIGPNNHTGKPTGNIFSYYKNNNKEYSNLRQKYKNWTNENQNIVIKCNEKGYYYEVNIVCKGEVKNYKHLPPTGISNKNIEQYFFNSFEKAKKNTENPVVQKALIKLALLHKCEPNS
jgi:hypothetical protein